VQRLHRKAQLPGGLRSVPIILLQRLPNKPSFVSGDAFGQRFVAERHAAETRVAFEIRAQQRLLVLHQPAADLILHGFEFALVADLALAPHGFYRFLRARIEHEKQRRFCLQQTHGFLRHNAQDFLKAVLLAEDGGEIDEGVPVGSVTFHLEWHQS